MLFKDRPIKFIHTGKTVESVFKAIQQGTDSKQMLVCTLHLSHDQVQRALWSLVYTGTVKRCKEGTSFRYRLPEKEDKPMFDTSILKINLVISCGEQ